MRSFSTRRHLIARVLLACLAALSAPGARGDTLPPILSAGGDRAVKRWDNAGHTAGMTLTVDEGVSALAVVPGTEGRLIVTGSIDGSIRVYNLTAGLPMLRMDTHSGPVETVAVSPAGRFIAAGGVDGHIRVFDRRTGMTLADVRAHSDAVRSVCFASDDLLISGSADRTLRMWNVRSDRFGVLVTYHLQIAAHDGSVNQVAVSPDGRLLGSVSEDGYLKTWRPDGGLMDRVRVSPRPVFALAFSPDGRTIATGDDEGRIKLWNSSNGTPVPFTGGHDRAIRALAWSADGETLVSGGDDQKIRYWDAAHGRMKSSVQAHDGPVRAITISQ